MAGVLDVFCAEPGVLDEEDARKNAEGDDMSRIPWEGVSMASRDGRDRGAGSRDSPPTKPSYPIAFRVAESPLVPRHRGV